MKEIEFRNWLIDNGTNPKVAGDVISRLKRVEREIDGCDIDDQYHIDRCKKLLSMFLDKGNNDEMRKYPNANFPIGKYYMSTYRYAIKKYIMFLKDCHSDD